MIRRIIKLMFYIKAPLKAFAVFHPVKAAKLWFAYVVGSALFGARKRAEAGASSGWGQPDGTPEKTDGKPAPAVAAGGEPASGVKGRGNGQGAAAGAPEGSSPDAVPAGASVERQGDQAS